MRKAVDKGVPACYDENMAVLTRTILAAVLFMAPLFAAAYPASGSGTEPVAQVYEVRGNATVMISADNSNMSVKKGCLLAPDDSLTLDPNTSISVYFKNGGRKEIRSKDTRASYRVADLAPQTQAYAQSVPLFGATRGLDASPASFYPGSFFYPQEAVVLDKPPAIEFTLFRGSDGELIPGNATFQVALDGRILDSRDFKGLEYGSPYVYQLPKLKGQTAYIVDLKLELQNASGNVDISFPLYISGIPDFSDAVYRSFESASMDHKGKKRAITAVKQLVRRGASSAPVIVIELFIP